MKTYFERFKKDIFPEITDWTDDQNHIRHEKDVSKLDFKHWFFLHPSAYNLIQYSISILGILLFGYLAYTTFKIIPLFLFIVVIVIWNCGGLFKKIKNRKFTKDMTLYDLLMRENKMWEVKE